MDASCLALNDGARSHAQSGRYIPVPDHDDRAGAVRNYSAMYKTAWVAAYKHALAKRRLKTERYAARFEALSALAQHEQASQHAPLAQ